MFPRRSASTHTERLDEELCVYDWHRKEVHALNATAARVWQMCDGRTSVRAMAATLAAEFDLADAHDLVWLALAALQEKHLLDGGVAASHGRNQMSRRALIGRLGATAAMLPIVTSIVAPTALQAQSLQSQTFTFTGAPQSFTVPAGVTSIMVDAYGAGGGVSYAMAPSFAGKGGRLQATLAAASGETLTVVVGGTGGNSPLAPGAGAAGFNGGAAGGAGGYIGGGGGGGTSEVRRGGTKLLVAGGGGGATIGINGGNGGATTGAPGGDGTYLGVVHGGGGGGGTQTAGGAGGTATTIFAGGTAGTSGSAGTGGTGASGPTGGAGGGGGGYFGGGGGGGDNDGFQPYSGGGGGGSSYTDPGATGVTHTQGANIGDGRIIISW